jgi:ethanolamine ammonia-lyase large subunit
MQIGLFRRIVQDLQNHNEYFLQKRDAAGKLGFSSIQKVTAAMRMMAYGCSADSIDEYTQMGKSSYIFTGSNVLYFDVAFLLKRRAPHLNA